MAEDDAFDAELTPIGRQQARDLHSAIAAELQSAAPPRPELGRVDLVVSSTLSRAIDTADAVFPPSAEVPRLAVEEWREAGMLTRGGQVPGGPPGPLGLAIP
jgi:broad specificity phosphatase PhoE